MFYWSVSEMLQYLQQFSFVGLCWIKLLEIERFEHSIVCIYK